MAKIFITGSADGLGSLAAQKLIEGGHAVWLHARSQERGEQALQRAPGAKGALVADLADLEQVTALAADANEIGRFDAVIHNAGILRSPADQLFAVNSLAPYVLTALITKPERLIYLSSGMHQGGRLSPQTMEHDSSYSDTKLQILTLAKAIARLWPDTYSNAVDPGWVPTKMGGIGAPDNLEAGVDTQVWLATSHDPHALVTGGYFFHQQQVPYSPIADGAKLQDAFLTRCHELSGVKMNQTMTS